LLVGRVGETIDGDVILRQHRAISRAIRRGQPAAAQRAMRRHLEYVLEQTLEVEGRR
jgi:DNA-binding FadR family transcriptional regulator